MATQTSIESAVQNLNANERAVLAATIEASGDNGFDFTFGDEIAVEGLSPQQVAGYLSQLFTKGYLDGERPTINGSTISAVQIDFYGTPVEFVHDGDDDQINAALKFLRAGNGGAQ